MKIISFILILLICFNGLLLAADIQISATIDHTVIQLEQSFTYTLEITGDKANSIKRDPKLPDIKEFAMYMGSSGTSQNIQIINGRMSVAKSMSFTFVATKIGKFNIGASELEYKGKIYRSKPINIEIVKQSSTVNRQKQNPKSNQSTQNQQSIEDNLYLRTFVDKKTVYVNEPIILSYKIYTNVTVTSYNVNKAPNTAGFWAEDFPLGNQPKTQRKMFKGQEFLVAEIKKTALFPTDPGTKEISPMQIECDVRVQRRRQSVFDSFFDDPFFGRSVRKSVFSVPVEIKVLPLPVANKPANFSGIVGDFSMSASVDKNNVKTNEAVALKIKIAGTGNIKIIPTPDIQIPSDFEQYEPKISQKINRVGDRISGSKIFEYVLVPRFPGLQKIKPFEFSYFDPASKSYKSIKTKELIINVEKGNDEFVVSGSGLSKEEVKLLGKDIRYIQTHIPELRQIGHYFHSSPFFLIILIIPVLMLVAAYSYSKHNEKLIGNVAYARSRKANQMAMNKLRKAKKALTEKTHTQFYAETSSALLGFLADKLNIAAAGIITDQIENMMKSRNIDNQVISDYLSCIQICNYQRFAPSKTDISEMNKFFDQAKSAIIALDKVI